MIEGTEVEEPKVEQYDADDEEINFSDVKSGIMAKLKVLNQPYVWIFVGVLCMFMAAAFFLGYMAGYEECLVMCNDKIQGMSPINFSLFG